MCGYKRAANSCRRTQEEFESIINDVNPNVMIIGNYINSKTNILCKCKKCGNEWFATPENLIRELSGCPKCKLSKGEMRIEKWLNQNKIQYKTQVKFEDLKGINNGTLSYDFYILDCNLLIEYQGEFHDGNNTLQSIEQLNIQKENDEIKREYAINNSYSLLYIWYTDYENIEKILESTLKIPVTNTV